ncbi:hypothetical protein ACJQWK_06607 [Exserohilum turcicum]
MRVTHLMYGLLGLASFTQAVPFPESDSPTSLSAEVKASQDAPHTVEAPIATLESSDTNNAPALGDLDTASSIAPGPPLVKIFPKHHNGYYAYLTEAHFGLCLTLPSHVKHDVSFVLKDRGIECTFYNRFCEDFDHVTTLEEFSAYFLLDDDVGALAGNVRCKKVPHMPVPPRRRSVPGEQDSGRQGEAQKQYALPADVHVSRIEPTTVSALIPAPPARLNPGDVYVCANIKSPGCALIAARNMCVSFGSRLAYKAAEIQQAGGSFCKYYTKPGCADADEYFRYTTPPRNDEIVSGWGVAKMAAVSCFAMGIDGDVREG